MTILQTVADISSDKIRVEKFIETHNSLEFGPAHLHDIVEDFIADL